MTQKKQLHSSAQQSLDSNDLLVYKDLESTFIEVSNDLTAYSHKTCTRCCKQLPIVQFYSKGKRKAKDSQCISCCLERKRLQRQKIKSKKQRRIKTKVLDLSNFKIHENFLEKPTQTYEELESLLRSYIIELVVKERKEGPCD